MKIFYILLDNKKTEKLSRKELRNRQSEIGRYIVDRIGKEIFSIKDTEIIIENSKPKYKNSNVHFSITHSNKIIAVAFDYYPVGIDIEYMKERDFKKLSEHYNINTYNKVEFYKKWTKLEAEIKLQSEIKQSYTTEIESDYIMTVVSSNPNDIIYEINPLK